MAIPGETPMPLSLCSLAVAPGVSSILIELAFDQPRQRLDRCRGVGSGRGNLDEGARGGGQHHQPHDRTSGDRGAVLAYPDIGLELRGRLDKPGGGAGMQSFLVTDLDGSPRGGQRLRRGFGKVLGGLGIHRRASASSCEATLMYLRPASCAPSTARSSFSFWRRLASLISIGRFTPAMTSILPRSMTEIARLDGVPPNISVSTTAPSPLSTSAMRRRISWRRSSISSSGPMQTAAIWACAPTTCSRAATNSLASRPCVT